MRTPKRRPVVGETLYSLNVNNEAIRKPQALSPVVVTKVGRKYFTCQRPDFKILQREYHLDTWGERIDGSPNSHLYETEQEWFDVRDAAQLTKDIKQVFSHYGQCTVPLDILRKIRALLVECGEIKEPEA